MSTNTGGPAFPVSKRKAENYMDEGGYGRSRTVTVTEGGMTLRDYFAAKAMQAMITKSNGQDSTGGAAGVPRIAKLAYEYADAMLVESEK